MLLQDVRYAFRSLIKHPGFTAIAVACLALGIGVNATIFSVVDGVILHPVSYPDGERLIILHSRNLEERVNRGPLSYADFKDVRDSATSFESLAAIAMRSLTIADPGRDAERYRGATVSWTLFQMLGTSPIEGRDFTAQDDKPGAEPVVMLSHELWTVRYQKDRGDHRQGDHRQWTSAHRDRRHAREVPVP